MKKKVEVKICTKGAPPPTLFTYLKGGSLNPKGGHKDSFEIEGVIYQVDYYYESENSEEKEEEM